MLFNSIAFGIFFVVFFCLYYAKESKLWQSTLLTMASLVFYGWVQPDLILLLLYSISVNAFFGWRIEHESSIQARKLLCAGALPSI